jgi:SAM-dependent methyltransferase
VDLSQQINYYNERWGEFQFANLLQLDRCLAILERMASTELLYPRICDLGCGAGWLSGILGCFGPTLGVDMSDAGTKAAAERYPYVEFRAADILNWDYPKEAFDIVVSQEVLEHVEDQPRLLSIAHGLLRKGGYLILTTPNSRSMNAMPEPQRSSWSTQPIENWVTKEQLRDLLFSAGFREIEITSITFGFGSRGLYRIVNSPKVQRAARLIGLRELWKESACRLGFGLHLATRSRKAS